MLVIVVAPEDEESENISANFYQNTRRHIQDDSYLQYNDAALGDGTDLDSTKRPLEREVFTM
jgi:hypothetical protein